jgi:hypothetical protein
MESGCASAFAHPTVIPGERSEVKGTQWPGKPSTSQEHPGSFRCVRDDRSHWVPLTSLRCAPLAGDDNVGLIGTMSDVPFALLNRIPPEHACRRSQIEEAGFQRGHRVVGDRLRRPAFHLADAANGARLRHEEQLVAACGENLARHVFRCRARQAPPRAAPPGRGASCSSSAPRAWPPLRPLSGWSRSCASTRTAR